MDVAVRVASKLILAQDVVEVTLAAQPPGAELPTWSAGAHIDVELPGGLRRRYSLCGQSSDLAAYRIAVLRTADSRGGSRSVHDDLAVGDSVRISAPRNKFALESAPTYLFLAGGIGITPMIPMLEEAGRRGGQWTLHYGGRSLESMAYAEELTNRYGRDRVLLYPEPETGYMNVAALLRGADPEALIYVCGPQQFIELVRSEARKIHRGGQVRAELFTTDRNLDTTGGTAFDVHLQRSGATVHVAAGCTVLEAILEAGIESERDCEVGVCGTCITGVLEGVVDHRDHVLDEQVREAQSAMALCVSRSKGETLVLDL